MTDFNKQLAENQRQIDELKKKNETLLAKRKEALPALLARFLEKLDLHTVSDTVLLGALVDVQTALKEESSKLQEWEKLGARFLKPLRKKSATTETT
jgi:hypothetical protein